MVFEMAVGGILLLSALFAIWAARYEKAGPNEVLVISGRKRVVTDEKGRKKTVGYRLIHGGGTFVWPFKEHAQRMSLELMNLEVKTPEVYTAHGVPVMVDGVAQIKVKGDDASIAIAAEQFLSRSTDDVMKTAMQVTEGHMRAVIGGQTIEDIYTKRKDFAEKVKEAASMDLEKMGLEIISLTVKNISDPGGYLEALGRPRTAQVKRDAIIGEAKAEEEAKTFRYKADTAIEQARRDHEIKKAEYEAAINQKKAESDLAYELQKYKTQQLVKKEEIQVSIIEKERSIELQEKEAVRKEKELAATVLKPADAERYKIETLAEAEKYKRKQEAAGDADAIRSRGFAEAEVVAAKGASEAETMHKKAESWSEYNEAAVTEMVVDILPQLAKAVAEPLSKTEKIIVISGGEDSAGASKITKDVAEVISQLPPVVESLTGVKIEELVGKVPAIGGKKGKTKNENSRKSIGRMTND
jgi:flotillin